MGGLRGSSVLGEQGASQHLRCRPGLTVQVGSLLAPRIVCPCMPCVYVRASPSSANDTCTWPCVYMAARSTHNLGRGGATAPRAGSRRRTDRARWRGTGGGELSVKALPALASRRADRPKARAGVRFGSAFRPEARGPRQGGEATPAPPIPPPASPNGRPAPHRRSPPRPQPRHPWLDGRSHRVSLGR